MQSSEKYAYIMNWNKDLQKSAELWTSLHVNASGFEDYSYFYTNYIS